MDKLREFFVPKDFWDKGLLICCAIILFVLAAVSLFDLSKEDVISQLLVIPAAICALITVGLTGRFIGKISWSFFRKSLNCSKNHIMAFCYFIAGILGSALTVIVLYKGYIEAPFWQKPRLSLEYYQPIDFWLWANALAFFLLYAFLKPKMMTE